MADELRPKQRAFIAEYMKDLNATQAAIRAGYSKKTAYAIGRENLNKPQIKSALEAAMADRARRSKITAEWVLEKIAEIATDPEAQPRDQLRALELLGRHLGIWDRKESDDDQKTIRVLFETVESGWAE